MSAQVIPTGHGWLPSHLFVRSVFYILPCVFVYLPYLFSCPLMITMTATNWAESVPVRNCLFSQVLAPCVYPELLKEKSLPLDVRHKAEKLVVEGAWVRMINMNSFDTDLGHGISLTATSGWSIHFRFIPGYTTNQEKHHWGEVVEGVHTQKTSPSLVVLRKLCQCDGSASLSSILILSSGTLLCCVLIVLFSVGFCWFYTWWPVEMGRLGQACWPQRHSHM